MKDDKIQGLKQTIEKIPQNRFQVCNFSGNNVSNQYSVDIRSNSETIGQAYMKRRLGSNTWSIGASSLANAFNIVDGQFYTDFDEAAKAWSDLIKEITK